MCVCLRRSDCPFAHSHRRCSGRGWRSAWSWLRKRPCITVLDSLCVRDTMGMPAVQARWTQLLLSITSRNLLIIGAFLSANRIRSILLASSGTGHARYDGSYSLYLCFSYLERSINQLSSLFINIFNELQLQRQMEAERKAKKEEERQTAEETLAIAEKALSSNDGPHW